MDGIGWGALGQGKGVVPSGPGEPWEYRGKVSVPRHQGDRRRSSVFRGFGEVRGKELGNQSKVRRPIVLLE